MDYQEYAIKLIDCMRVNELAINKNVSEIAKGELGVLLYLIDKNNGANAYEISQEFGVNTSRVAAVLNSLSKKGYIQRTVDPEDKRKIQVFVTEEGKTFGEDRRQEIIHRVMKVITQLGEKDVREYMRISQRIYEIVGKER